MLVKSGAPGEEDKEAKHAYDGTLLELLVPKLVDKNRIAAKCTFWLVLMPFLITAISFEQQ